MKKLTKILSLFLALGLSSSLFACKDEGVKSNPNESLLEQIGDDELTLNPVDDPVNQIVDGNLIFDVLQDRITPKLSYNETNDYAKWEAQMRQKFLELFKMNKFKANECPLDVTITDTTEVEATAETPAYTRYHILYNSEYGSTVPCYLLVPKAKGNYPLAITVHGHSAKGYHYAAGTVVSDDPEVMEYANKVDYAVQAVEQGYAALAIEQRGMSDRYAESSPDGASMCEFAANQELILGRTIVGGRVWDISKGIDMLLDAKMKDIVSKINLKDITVTGNSGGGTASFYAACYDERITTCAPSCGFAPYEDSIMNTYHCSCNFVPGVYEWFNMQDLACLIAPRKLAVIVGATDTIFPFKGVTKAFKTIEKIYEKEGKKENCNYEMTTKGHEWVQSVVWPAINDIRAK